MRLYCLALAAVLVTACGGKSPTAPTPPPPPPQPAQLAGGWTGTFETSNYLAEAVAMDLTQVGSSINGTWAFTRGLVTGTLTGTVDTSQFSGVVTYRVGASSCQAAFSGSASAATINWTSPGFTGDCGLAGANPINVRLVLQRR
jgi:hypothetical protein